MLGAVEVITRVLYAQRAWHSKSSKITSPCEFMQVDFSCGLVHISCASESGRPSTQTESVAHSPSERNIEVQYSMARTSLVLLVAALCVAGAVAESVTHHGSNWNPQAGDFEAWMAKVCILCAVLLGRAAVHTHITWPLCVPPLVFLSSSETNHRVARRRRCMAMRRSQSCARSL